MLFRSPNAYGITLDQAGNVWFAELRRDGRIGKVDAKTMQVTKYQPPTATGFPRRIQVDNEGLIWFAEFQAGRIGQFDPKTERFKEFALPGEKPTPYALGVDADHKIWYSSEWMDVLGRLDPAWSREPPDGSRGATVAVRPGPAARLDLGRTATTTRRASGSPDQPLAVVGVVAATGPAS